MTQALTFKNAFQKVFGSSKRSVKIDWRKVFSAKLAASRNQLEDNKCTTTLGKRFTPLASNSMVKSDARQSKKPVARSYTFLSNPEKNRPRKQCSFFKKTVKPLLFVSLTVEYLADEQEKNSKCDKGTFFHDLKMKTFRQLFCSTW